MKTRNVIATYDAIEIQKQLNVVKHGRARKLLESRLCSTYIESFIDLDSSKAIIWVPYQSYVSNRVKEEINDMAFSITKEYPKIKLVDIYGQDAIIEACEKGEFKTFPKSSIIQPQVEGDENLVPPIMIDNIDQIHCDKETRSEVETLMDLRDNTFQKMNEEPAIGHGDREAGEIKIIIETANTPNDIAVRIDRSRYYLSYT